MSTKQPRQQQGRRLRALNDAFHKTCKYALRPLDPADFEACFPGLAPEFVAVAYDAYQQALHKARVLAETDFQQISEENALRDKLYALEQLCEEQGVGDGGELAEGGSEQQQRREEPARAAALGEAQQQELERLQQVLQQAKERLGEDQSQLAARQQQLRSVLQKARPIALANQQVHDASKAWGSRQPSVVI